MAFVGGESTKPTTSTLHLVLQVQLALDYTFYAILLGDYPSYLLPFALPAMCSRGWQVSLVSQNWRLCLSWMGHFTAELLSVGNYIVGLRTCSCQMKEAMETAVRDRWWKLVKITALTHAEACSGMRPQVRVQRRQGCTPRMIPVQTSSVSISVTTINVTCMRRLKARWSPVFSIFCYPDCLEYAGFFDLHRIIISCISGQNAPDTPLTRPWYYLFLCICF